MNVLGEIRPTEMSDRAHNTIGVMTPLSFAMCNFHWNVQPVPYLA